MSYTETHIGKLKKMEPQPKDREKWAEHKCREMGLNELGYCSTWYERLTDRMHEKYFIHHDEIWEVIEHKELGDDDLYEMSENSDGTISFTMRFYNGGTCLTECIEDGLLDL